MERMHASMDEFDTGSCYFALSGKFNKFIVQVLQLLNKFLKLQIYIIVSIASFK